MPRLKLSLPVTFAFSTELDVRITDINYGNHLGNDALLSLLHEARVRWLRSLGMSEGNVEGRLLIMSDAAICYRAESFAGDRLRIDVAACDATGVSCDIVYQVVRTTDQVLVAQAKTGVVFLDPQTRKVSRLPETLRALASATL
ncbi:MAG: thioesterase family protein [Deltaproteobacteria bacterium]|nr:thioesterase family protein [Deltaproteobacteria bacterium]